MPISPESFNRIREANARYGDEREALGLVKAVAEAAPSEANAMKVKQAEEQATRALKEFQRALGAADITPRVLGP
jgi:hypothetical protein